MPGFTFQHALRDWSSIHLLHSPAVPDTLWWQESELQMHTLLYSRRIIQTFFLFSFSWGLDWVSELCTNHWNKVFIQSADLCSGEHLGYRGWWSMCSAYYNGNGHSLEILRSTSLWSIVEWHTLDLMYRVNGFPVELAIWLLVQALHWLHDPMDWPGLGRCPILDDWWSYCKEISVLPIHFISDIAVIVGISPRLRLMAS